MAARVLRGRGYRVTEATSAEAALVELAREDVDYDALITEVVLPGMDGVALVHQALSLRPALRASFCTGYSPPTVERLLSSGATRRILQKPFTPSTLLTHLRYVLER